MTKSRSGTRLIWAGVIVLIILRQDFWFWHNPSLVLGMFPIGLAWQIGISIAAAALWYTATRIAWPADEPARVVEPTTAAPNDASGETT